jgi:ABC-type glycerol-3-phosphate transport system substrate-binding protein
MVMFPASLTNYTMENSNYAAFIASSLLALQMVSSRLDSELALFPGITQGAWLPSTITGITADTNVPELAGDFINIMLSEGVQSFNYGTGLAVTRAGITSQVDVLNEMDQFGDDFTFDSESFIGKLEVPVMIDTILENMIWVHIERFINNEVDIENTIRSIEQAISNYLAERER